MGTTTIDKPVVSLPDAELIGIFGVILVSLISLGFLINLFKTERDKLKNIHMHLTVVVKQDGNKIIIGLYDQKDPSARTLATLFIFNENWWIERIKCGDGYVKAIFFEGDEYTRTLHEYITQWTLVPGLLTPYLPTVNVAYCIPNIAHWAMLIEYNNLKITTGTPGTVYYREIKINQCFNMTTLQWEDNITPTHLIVDGIKNTFHPPHNYRPEV